MKTNFLQQETDLLLGHYFSGMVTQEMEGVVQGWMADHAGHAAKDASLAKMFFRKVRPNRHFDPYTRDSLQVLHRELNFSDHRARKSLFMPTATPVTPRRRKHPLRYIVGSAIATAAVFAGVWLTTHVLTTSTTPIPAEVTAPRQFVERSAAGTVRALTLPDGTTVRLKNESTLTYADNFSANRLVRLDGEAFFSVARDEQHPFVVEGNEVTVTVLGTEFNARMVSSDTLSEVVVSSGRVQVASGASTVSLDPSQKATVDHQSRRIVTAQAGPGELLRHTGRELVFEDVPLGEVLQTIGEYFNVEMRLVDDLPAAGSLTLNMGEDATLAEALELLHAINPIFRYRIEEDVVVITLKR